jgi:Skp family chaperone for outer membrane proteins
MLKKAKDDAVKDLYKVIDAAVETIAQKRGMALVIDTDKESVTFINPIMGEDITEDVKALLVR